MMVLKQEVLPDRVAKQFLEPDGQKTTPHQVTDQILPSQESKQGEARRGISEASQRSVLPKYQ